MGQIVTTIAQKVDEALLVKRETPRTYLGASSLGTECDRQLWLSFFFPKEVDKAEVLRKFKVGHYLEPMVVELLKNAGFQVWELDEDGSQFGFKDGQIAGHCDGFIMLEGEPHLLEIKTANSFSFKNFVKKGFTDNERYRVQVQVYMHKFKLKNALCVVMNKDSQEMYYEIVPYDKIAAEYALRRGQEILDTELMPDRKYVSKMNFKCKFCNYYKECWDEDSSFRR